MKRPDFDDRHALLAFIRRAIPEKDRKGLHLERMPLASLWDLVVQHRLGERFWKEYQ